MERIKIKIGICAPLSGLAFKLGLEMKQAIELAVKERNEQGGIAGNPVELIVLDDESKVARAEDAARELCNDEQVIGVIGHYGSDTSLAAAKIYNENSLVLVSPIASNSLLTESGLANVFRYTNRDNQTADAISGYLYDQLKKRKATVVKTDTAYGNSMADEFKRSFTKFGGEVLNTVVVKEGDRNFVQLLQHLPNGFDLLFYGGTFEGAHLLKAMRAAGFDQLMATGDGCWDKVNFLEPAQDVAETGEGVLVLSASSAIGDVNGSYKFSEKYEMHYGPVVNYALNCYDAACLLLKAIEQAFNGDQNIPTRDGVLNSIRKIDFRGIANPNQLIWNDKGDNIAAITKLNIVEAGNFNEIAHIDLQ